MYEQAGVEGRGHRLGRRQVIATVALTLGGLATRPSTAAGQSATPQSGEEVSHGAEAIHQEPVFTASRKRVYEALTETAQFDKVIELSGAKGNTALGSEPTSISSEVGGAFVLFGGHILGRHVELTPSVRIVQAWRVADWAPGIYSIARFELMEQGAGTRIVFDHTGFPRGLGAHLAIGWTGHYWEPLAKLLA